MERNDIARLRLINQQLSGSAFRTPAKLVDFFGTIQAQSLAQAKWAMGRRLPETHNSDINRSIEDRSIVRTWLLRGNLSFATAQDLPWLMDYISPRVMAAISKRFDSVGLDASSLLSGHDIIFRELKQYKLRTRDELLAALDARGINTEGERGYLFLSTAALEKLIVCGPGRGKQSNFCLYDDVVKPGRSLSDDEALAELALRYFNSRGPALLADFAWWAGLSLEEAKKGLKSVAPQLSAVKSEGQLYFMPSYIDSNAGTQEVILLPAFDEYLLGYLERSPVLDPRYAKDLMPKQNGVFMPMIISRGEIIGTWTIEVDGEALRLQTKPFRPFLEQEEQGIRQAGLSYIEFMSKEKKEKAED